MSTQSDAGPSQDAKAPSGGSAAHTVARVGAISDAGPSQGAKVPSGGSAAHAVTSVGALYLDAEALYRDLLRGVTGLCQPETRLVGVPSGGAWLAQRLQQDLGLEGAPGTLSSAMHRDDFSRRGLAAGGQTQLPFDVDDAHIIILDDVLYTGRTIRAVINELFDYGRPASVRLAVLVDRGGRELPIQPNFAAARVVLPPNQSLALARDAQGTFSFNVEAT
jgi:pyrimidine operon attenuation protein / uracil phosphoribosyltransferase